VVGFAKWQRAIQRWWVGIALQVAGVGIPASWAFEVWAFGDDGLRLGRATSVGFGLGVGIQCWWGWG